MNVPDSPVPVTGFRIWGVTYRPDGARLQSATSGFLGGLTDWEPYVAFEASCLAARACGGAPNPLHNCGVHSFRELGEAMVWAGKVGRVRPVVVGLVRLWGVVVEGERGWRAQFAYPAEFVAGFSPRDRKELAAAYGVGFAA